MNESTFQQSINRLRSALIEKLPAINERMALDASAMVKDRIVNTGFNAKGMQLGEYSKAEVPLFFYKNGKLMAPFSRPLNNSGQALVDKVKKENKARRKNGQDPRGISYKEWREANNRPADKVNLSFSGTTMKDIGLVKQFQEGSKIIAKVGPKNTVSRAGGTSTSEVVEGLGDKYGNFLEPNDEEINKLKNYLENETKKIIYEAFNR